MHNFFYKIVNERLLFCGMYATLLLVFFWGEVGLMKGKHKRKKLESMEFYVTIFLCDSR